ncbi:glycosyltransferase [Dermatophilaceae bacterium Sec6.4]
MPVITRVGVVVPARDESRLLPRCLSALAVAGDHLRAASPGIELQIVVVLDSCTDDSAEIVRRHPGVAATATTVGIVGAARQVGVDHLARTLDPDWFAVTDADSAVPGDWLQRQVQIGSDGADLVLGTVIPDGKEISPGRLTRWEQAHSNADGHGHVYGANLGFSRRALEVTGGFRALAVHEDVDLADRVKAAGLQWVATAGLPVLTSARMVGRTPDGFAGYLRAN